MSFIISSILVNPIPINSIARNTEVNYITTHVHASLKNWKAQMNSKMFRISQKPVLLKFQKLLFEAKFDEKHECCQTIRATNPIAKIMNTGI